MTVFLASQHEEHNGACFAGGLTGQTQGEEAARERAREKVREMYHTRSARCRCLLDPSAVPYKKQSRFSFSLFPLHSLSHTVSQVVLVGALR